MGNSRKAPSQCCGNVLNFALTVDTMHSASHVVWHSVCVNRRGDRNERGLFEKKSRNAAAYQDLKTKMSQKSFPAAAQKNNRTALQKKKKNCQN